MQYMGMKENKELEKCENIIIIILTWPTLKPRTRRNGDSTAAVVVEEEENIGSVGVQTLFLLFLQFWCTKTHFAPKMSYTHCSTTFLLHTPHTLSLWQMQSGTRTQENVKRIFNLCAIVVVALIMTFIWFSTWFVIVKRFIFAASFIWMNSVMDALNCSLM